MSRRLLIIFTKHAEYGNVKTRLSASIGDEKALKVFKWLRNAVKDAALGLRNTRTEVFVCGKPLEESFWQDEGITVRSQEGQDLGERMHRAMSDGFARGFDKVVLMGTDVHGVTTGIIDRAFEQLDHFDVVLGPANDGGYYLVGLAHPLPELFLERQWSHPRVLKEAVATASELNLTCGFVKNLVDIDTYDDLEQTNLNSKL